MVERIKELCAARGIRISNLEHALGFANGSISKTSGKTEFERLKKIADFFDVSIEYLTEGKSAEKESTSGKKYYFDDETAEFAEEVFQDKNLRALFDAARGTTPEEMKIAADMLARFKGNSNG